jgi:hypothetical protein
MSTTETLTPGIDPELSLSLRGEGFVHLRHIPGLGLCGIKQYIVTFGIVVGIDEMGYQARFCFEHFADAELAFHDWDGTDYPSGPWIKLKGFWRGQPVDLLNPKLRG